MLDAWERGRQQGTWRYSTIQVGASAPAPVCCGPKANPRVCRCPQELLIDGTSKIILGTDTSGRLTGWNEAALWAMRSNMDGGEQLQGRLAQTLTVPETMKELEVLGS